MTWLKRDDDHDMFGVDDDAHAMHMIDATITLGCYKISLAHMLVIVASKLLLVSGGVEEGHVSSFLELVDRILLSLLI